jgi:archaellin
VAGTTGSSGTVAQLKFTIANVLGGEPVDFTIPTDAGGDGVADTGSSNVVVINYHDQTQTVDDLYWTISKLGNADTDDLLEANERFEITIGGAGGVGDLEDALTTALTVKTTFNIEILTPSGATLTIERTTPAWIDTIVNLH